MLRLLEYPPVIKIVGNSKIFKSISHGPAKARVHMGPRALGGWDGVGGGGLGAAQMPGPWVHMSLGHG